MPYPTPRGLGNAIANWSDVSASGLDHALQQLTPGQQALVGAVSGSVYLPDPITLAVADGLVTNDQAGTDQAQAVHMQLSRGLNVAQLMATAPALAGLWTAWMALNAWRDTPSADPAQALAAVTAGVPAGPYLDAVRRYFALILATYRASVADTATRHEQAVATAVQYARQDALTRGATVLGNGVTVASELIRAQVELPDGTIFVVMDDVTGDPANRYVYTWQGPHWTPLSATGGWIETATGVVCTGIVPGTGSWYLARVLGQVVPGSSCDATPPNFAGPWDLITPDIAAALTYQNGAPVQVVPPAQQPTGGSVGGSGGVAPAPPIITQDQDGNPIPGDVGPHGTTTPVIVSTLPVAVTPSGTNVIPSPGAPAAGIPTNVAIIAAAAAAVTFAVLLASRGRR